MTTNIAVFGSHGFAGTELVNLLHSHPGVGELRICERNEDFRALVSTEVIFLAIPAERSLELVSRLLKNGNRVIDLSGAFRLQEPRLYPLYYPKLPKPHPHPNLLRLAVYGLPELNRDSIKRARLVANPGCYAIATVLPLLPLKSFLDTYEVVRVDAISGYTGAGKGTEIPDVVKPYKPGRMHQHVPEIEQALGIRGILHFYPCVAPFPRGISVRITLPENVRPPMELYTSYYEREPFVRVVTRASILDIDGSNLCRISVHDNVVYAAIDNLRKGAASEAVQNFNIMMGFRETEGLL